MFVIKSRQDDLHDGQIYVAEDKKGFAVEPAHARKFSLRADAACYIEGKSDVWRSAWNPEIVEFQGDQTEGAP